jgi:signal transduction histidine kinase
MRRGSQGDPAVTQGHLLRLAIRSEHDVFVVRQRGREVAGSLGLETQDQIRVATALSEVGRQLLARGAEAGVAFEVRTTPEPALAIVLTAPDLAGTGGVAAAARLMEVVETTAERVVLTRRLPAPFDYLRVARVREELAASQPTSAVDELSVQNRQLVAALDEVQEQRNELLALNAELEETNHGVMALYHQLSQELEQTNQGVVALYAELDERSVQLREASEAKSRFLANVSHELRAPVTAIIGLTRLLLDAGSDPLTESQQHELRLIQASATDLLERVSDLLDLAKAESNRIEPQWVPVAVGEVLDQLGGTLRAMAKPEVRLVIGADSPELVTDPLLLTQILRNLIANALKFTESGEVRVTARRHRDRVEFVVADTGIGIPLAEQNLIFEEFHQVRGAQAVGGGGTGLGLPYARRLAGLLGGELTLTSTPRQGSTFTVSLPPHPPAPPATIRSE